MADKKEEIKEYVETLLRAVQRKIEAKERDTLGLLGEDVELTDEELLAYKFVNLETDKREREFIFKRYLSEEEIEQKDLQDELGITKPTYYRMREKFLLRLDGYLRVRGYGYDNASRDRVGLPDKLNNGRYIRSGVDFVHEDTDGDLYNLAQGALDLQRYNEIRVVPTIELLLTYIGVDEVELKGSDGAITECYLVKEGKAGLGVLVKVNSAIYDGLLDVFTELEQKLEELLGFEEVNELLKLAVVVEFETPFEDNWLE